MNTVIRDAAIVCAFAFTFGATRAGAQTTAWREDLAYMAREMPRRHKNLYHTIPRVRFDSAVAALNRRIPQLERHQIIVDMARIAALVGEEARAVNSRR